MYEYYRAASKKISDPNRNKNLEFQIRPNWTHGFTRPAYHLSGKIIKGTNESFGAGPCNEDIQVTTSSSGTAFNASKKPRYSLISLYSLRQLTHEVAFLNVVKFVWISKLKCIFAVGCTDATRPRNMTGSGSFSSPKYPSNYVNNSNCRWLLTSTQSSGVSC